MTARPGHEARPVFIETDMISIPKERPLRIYRQEPMVTVSLAQWKGMCELSRGNAKWLLTAFGFGIAVGVFAAAIAS